MFVFVMFVAWRRVFPWKYAFCLVLSKWKAFFLALCVFLIFFSERWQSTRFYYFCSTISEYSSFFNLIFKNWTFGWDPEGISIESSFSLIKFLTDQSFSATSMWFPHGVRPRCTSGHWHWHWHWLVLLYVDQFAVVSAHEHVLEKKFWITLDPLVSERQVVISMWYNGLFWLGSLCRQRLLPFLWYSGLSTFRSHRPEQKVLKKKKKKWVPTWCLNNSGCIVALVLQLWQKIIICHS